ncbi:hypothetical protein ACFU98_37910 [Streptomyces sp. NPDC057575]
MDFALTTVALNRPDPFGVIVVLMDEVGYRVRLTEAFAADPAGGTEL